MSREVIKGLGSGDKVVDFFLVRKKELRVKRESKEVYLALELGDQSGRISATVWENVEAVNDQIKVGQAVKVRARVIDYRGKPHLSIERIRPATDEEDVKPEEFVPQCPESIEKLLTRLDGLVKTVKNRHLSTLLRTVFQGQFLREEFAKAAAGKLWHHNYQGGLLQHTIAVAEICHAVYTRYDYVDRDLLITGALLHDIGKVKELQIKGSIDYSDEGRLVGHIVLGAQLVRDRIKEVLDFPDELATRLEHLVLSHQGKNEYGAPVVPMTMEAIILYYADELDSKAKAFERIVSQEKATGKKWSRYVDLINRFIYLGENEEE